MGIENNILSIKPATERPPAFKKVIVWYVYQERTVMVMGEYVRENTVTTDEMYRTYEDFEDEFAGEGWYEVVENGGGIARGPLIQAKKPVHLHISGGPWARGVIDGKNCWV